MNNVTRCEIIRRLNRFVVMVRVKNNSYPAWINNTGRLEQFLVPGRKGFCVKNKKKSKTDYRLFAIEENNLGALIDTQMQMKALEKSVESGAIPWLEQCRILKGNARLGNSLIDYLLVNNESQIYLEVKSAVLREGYYAMYPDCPSARGRKHIKELTNFVKNGGRAIILFIAALPGVGAFKPNQTADPELYQLLVKAQEAGLELRAISMFYHPQTSSIRLSNPDLNINWLKISNRWSVPSGLHNLAPHSHQRIFAQNTVPHSPD